MEHYDDMNTTPPASNGAGSNASIPPIPPDQSSSGDSSIPCGTASAQPWPNTAIERQIARDNYRKRTYRLTADRPPPPRRSHPDTTRRIFRSTFLASGLIVLLLVAAGMIFIINDRDHRVQNAVTQFLQNQFLEDTKQTAATPNPSVANAAPSVNENTLAATSNVAAISVPISDISLQHRPEFLEQLVQVYRTQLASKPNDSHSLAALAQLQDRSLSELQMTISQGDEETAKTLMSTAVRIFPELSSNTRYMYLVTRMDFIQRQRKDEAIAKTELSNTSPASATASASASASTPAISATATPASPSPVTTIPPEKVASAPTPVSATTATTRPVAGVPVTAIPVTTAAAPTVPAAAVPEQTVATKKIVTPIPDASPTIAKRAPANAVSLKPEIRAVSVTPGTMVDGQFVPSDEGNMFLVEIGYRNFDKAFVEKPEATLVTRLGVPGDSMVLAEVPMVITADRGTTSFVAETYVQSSRGGKLQLNFILNDEFLTSRTLRISIPRRAAVEN